MDRMSFVVFNSELGWMAAAASGEQLCRLTFGHPSPVNAVTALACDLDLEERSTRYLDSLRRRLQNFSRRPADSFQDIQLAIEYYTDFQRAIVEHCRRIPAGATKSYGQLAKAAGYPGAARAVGQVMATNRFPIVVPCHRVVGANGSLGGFSAPDGLTLKRRLLDLEAEVVRVGCCG